MSDSSVSLDPEVEDREMELASRDRLYEINQLYDSGKLLFPRHLLADLRRQIDQGGDEIQVTDLNDVRRTYSLKVPKWCADYADTYRIEYHSIQSLTCVFPEESFLRNHAPVSICYTRGVTNRTCDASLDDIRAIFAEKRQAWRASATCRSLEQQLSTLLASVSPRIDKIVCFALGSLGPCKVNERGTIRSHAQHAAVETMVEFVKKVHGISTVQCFAQEPAYTEKDRLFLHELGISALDDPDGFLAVDEHTLVFSVSPNVPVKQIIADVQWPAAMIWNTVSQRDDDSREWRKDTDPHGEISWICPFTTDPDSSRVREMVMHYAQASLQDPDEYVGDLTVYVQ